MDAFFLNSFLHCISLCFETFELVWDCSKSSHQYYFQFEPFESWIQPKIISGIKSCCSFSLNLSLLHVIEILHCTWFKRKKCRILSWEVIIVNRQYTEHICMQPRNWSNTKFTLIYFYQVLISFFIYFDFLTLSWFFLSIGSFAFFSDHTVGIWAIKSGTDVNDNGENME